MAFRIGLSGLNAASTDLSVTADNIANSNTNGFKQLRTEFSDVVAKSIAGSNLAGDGVQLATISQEFDQGNVIFTGNPLDLAISGPGFFRVSDSGGIAYARAGAFNTDRDGFIVNATGQRLTGFGADANGTIGGTLTDLQIDTADVAPQPTTGINLGANLDATAATPTAAFDPNNPATFNDAAPLTFFDSLGSPHTATLFFRKTGPNAWENYLTVDGTQVGGATALTFDTNGSLTAPASGQFTSAAFTPAGASAQTLLIDINQVTQFGNDFNVNLLTQDGFASGQLAGVEVEGDGVLFARYSNGESRALGQVALANFTSEQGLKRVGEGNWTETLASGQPLIGAPGTGRLGVVNSGAIEESNVELTAQLVNVINSQRNFQANAQVITASDTLTQTILNIS